MDSLFHSHPSVPCPGLSPVSSPVSAVGTGTLYSSPRMDASYHAETTLGDNLAEGKENERDQVVMFFVSLM